MGINQTPVQTNVPHMHSPNRRHASSSPTAGKHGRPHTVCRTRTPPTVAGKQTLFGSTWPQCCCCPAQSNASTAQDCRKHPAHCMQSRQGCGLHHLPPSPPFIHPNTALHLFPVLCRRCFVCLQMHHTSSVPVLTHCTPKQQCSCCIMTQLKALCTHPLRVTGFQTYPTVTRPQA